MVLFNASTVSLRWEHNFRVCAGDFIDSETLDTVYKGKIPKFYMIKEGQFMEIYCFFYVGVFLLVTAFGFIITLVITYKTTYGDVRLAHDPEYEPAYQTAVDDENENEGEDEEVINNNKRSSQQSQQLGQVMNDPASEEEKV